jgi:hypothetical protein
MVAVQEHPASFHETLRVSDLAVHIESQHANLVSPLMQSLARFRQPSGADEHPWRIHLRYGDPAEPARVPVTETWQGDLEGVPARLLVGRAFWRIEVPDRACFDFDVAAHGSTATIRPGMELRIFDLGVLPAVLAALRRRRQYAMHAACLAIPNASSAGGAAALIVVGQSGAGKTTTSLALAQSGATIATDDITVLCCDDTEKPKLAVWGFPKWCKILPHTLRLLPWLSALPTARNALTDGCMIDPTHTPNFQAVPLGARMPPGLVVFLERPNGVGHRIASLGSAEALTLLARENIILPERSDPVVSAQIFSALAALVRSTPVCRVSVGPQLDTLYGELAPLVRG